MPRGKKKSSKKKTSKKKTSKKKTSRRGATAMVPHVVAAVGLAERLTDEILELDRRGKNAVSRNVVQIGRRLLRLQQHLGFGEWLSWLSRRLPFTPRTAQRYIQLAAWADAFPDDFEAFAHLGLGKLQLLAALSPQRRARFRRDRRFSIPGSTERKRLEIMTAAELALVIEGSSSFGIVPPAIPIDTVVRRFRHRIAGLDAMADVLRERADEVDHDDVQTLVDELREVLTELETVVG